MISIPSRVFGMSFSFAAVVYTVYFGDVLSSQNALDFRHFRLCMLQALRQILFCSVHLTYLTLTLDDVFTRKTSGACPIVLSVLVVLSTFGADDETVRHY